MLFTTLLWRMKAPWIRRVSGGLAHLCQVSSGTQRVLAQLSSTTICAGDEVRAHLLQYDLGMEDRGLCQYEVPLQDTGCYASRTVTLVQLAVKRKCDLS